MKARGLIFSPLRLVGLLCVLGLTIMVLTPARTRAGNPQLPADAQTTCTVASAEFKSWFGGTVTVNGAVTPADSINFPNIPNCSFYQWAERMFLWLTSPTDIGHTFDSPGFFDVSPEDANGKRTFLLHPLVGNRHNLSLRAAQVGPNRLPVIFDKAGRMLEVQPPQLAASGKLIVLNDSGQVVEVEHSKLENGKPIFLDKSGKPIVNGKPVPQQKLKPKMELHKLNTSRIVQKVVIGHTPVFITLDGTVVAVEQGQAVDNAVLEAQTGSLVYYATMVNDVFAYFASMEKSQNLNDPFPTTQGDLNRIIQFAASHGKTFSNPNALAIEVKSSWVEVTQGLSNIGSYITMTATIPTYDTTNPTKWVPNGQKTVSLALVGVHIVGSTSAHPEMIWATFEHVNNTPLATYTYNSSSGPQTVSPSTSGPWLFSASVPTSNDPHMHTVGHNIEATPSHTISPSDTIRWKSWGAASDVSPNPIDPDTTASNTEILSINNSVRGMLASGDVRSNYIMTGATWTIPGTPPVPPGNQVGTSQLANSTMETYQQGQDTTAKNGGTNCFTCHQDDTNPALVTTRLSHIYVPLQPLSFVGAGSTCQITFNCPQAIYTPPDFTVACAVPVSFFFQYPGGERWPLGTGTSQSGTSDNYNTAVVACDFSTNQNCAVYPVGVGPANWCSPPPPPAPPPTPGRDCCSECIKAGGTCTRTPKVCTCS